MRNLIEVAITAAKVHWLGWETDRQMAEAGKKPLPVEYQIRTNGNETARILAPLARKMYLNKHGIDLLEDERGFHAFKRIEVNKDWQYPHIFYLEIRDQDVDRHPIANRLVFNLKPDKTLKFKKVERWFMGGTISANGGERNGMEEEFPAGWYDSRGKQALPSVN